MTIDTDGIRDKCSECGAHTESVKLIGGWVIDCIGCDNGFPMPQESEDKVSRRWNIQERERQQLSTEGGLDEISLPKE